LCEHACSSQDLLDVAAALNQAIAGIQDIGGKHQQVMRTAAGRLRTASESDNVTALRILVRYQSAELLRLADDAGRENEALAASLRGQVTELTAGLKIARQEARQDTLTGLLNRRALEEMMADFEKRDTPRCLILLDLDRFKSINDRFGYLAGDELLRQVAVRIQSALLPSCAAARWGGDEFIVLVDGSISMGMSVAQKLDQQLRTRYKLGEGQAASVYAQASVGLSDWKRGDNANTVVERANLALKAKKRSVDPGAGDPAR
jgi:diguanylate cyclase